MSYRSTPENRHFGASFTSIGGVESKILMSPKWTFSDLFRCSGTSISRFLHPLRTWNLHQSVYFQECYDMTLRQESENQNLPPCFEKVFFRKISLRGLQWYILSHVYPLWCWKINVWKFSDSDPTLILSVLMDEIFILQFFCSMLMIHKPMETFTAWTTRAL